MRTSRVATQALRLASDSARQPYVCRACARQFHASAPSTAEVPFWKRMQESIFGSEKSKKEEESREVKRKERVKAAESRTPGVRAQKKGRDGQTYEIAELVDPESHTDYKPTMSWNGLERMGGDEWVRRRADKGEQYVGFMPSKQQQLTNAQWIRTIHHVTVELLTLAKAGRDVNQICYASSSSQAAWELTGKARVVAKGDTTEAQFPNSEAESKLLAEIPNVEPKSFAHPKSLLANMKSASSEDWHAEKECLRLSVEEPVVKLTLLKRIMQLTGKRIPDAAISQAWTVEDLYMAFRVPEKPKKLVDAPEMKSLDTDLPNVTVHRKKRTSIHKEKRIGRWKLIEDELVQRNLPVFRKDAQNIA